MEHSPLLAARAPFHIEYADGSTANRPPMEHFHNACELALFVRADIDIFVKNRRYDIRDGDMLFIDAHEIHRMIYKPNQHYERYVINFQEAFLTDLLRALRQEDVLQAIRDRPGARIRLTPRQRLAMEEEFRRLYALQQEREAGDDDPTLEPAIRMRLLLLLQAVYRIGRAQRGSRTDGRGSELAQRIIRFVDERYAEPITLADLEAVAGKSKYHLSRTFRETTRFSVFEYVQYRRVIEAQKKLLRTDLSILDVGLSCGFPSLQHFYRVFKKLSGVTPAQYRAQREP